MIIVENTDNKITIPVGIGVVQTDSMKNFYNTSDANITPQDVLVNKIGYGKYGKVTGTLNLDNEKQESYNSGYNEGIEIGRDEGYTTGYNNGEQVGYNNGYQTGQNVGYNNGVGAGRQEIIDEQSDANITPSKVISGYIGYGANNERVVGTAEALTSIDVAATGIKFGYSTFTQIPSYFDFSNVIDMNHMFANASKLLSPPSATNLPNIKDFQYAFNSCSALTEIPLYNTQDVSSFQNTFYGCAALTEIPPLNFDNVVNYRYMCYGCYKLVTVPAINSAKINGDIPSIVAYSPFYSCSKLENFGGFTNLGQGYTGSSNKNFYMGSILQALTRESMLNVFNGLYDMNLNTSYTGTPSLYVSKYAYQKCLPEDIAIATTKGWTIVEYNG